MHFSTFIIEVLFLYERAISRLQAPFWKLHLREYAKFIPAGLEVGRQDDCMSPDGGSVLKSDRSACWRGSSMFGPERVKVFHSDVLQHQPQPLEGLWLVNVSRRAHSEHGSSGECREFPG